VDHMWTVGERMQGVVSGRWRAAAKGALVAAVPTCLAAGTSAASLTAGHLALLAGSLFAAGVVASLVENSDQKKLTIVPVQNHVASARLALASVVVPFSPRHDQKTVEWSKTT
jgi:hypothetical protein